MCARARMLTSGVATQVVAAPRNRCKCKAVANIPSIAATNLSRDVASRSTALALVQWAIANNIKFTGCRPDVRNGVRGVYAISDCNTGENLVAVPLQSSIAIQPGEKSPFPDFIPQDVWLPLPWYGQLACKLLHERSLGATSRFADYLPALPAAVDLPALWPPEHVRRLQYPYLEEQILDEQEEWERLYNTLRPHLARRGLSREDLQWALSCVRSRTFAGPYFPTPPAVKLATGAMAAAVLLAAAAALGGTDGGGSGLDGVASALPAFAAAVGIPTAWQAAEGRRAESGEPGTVMYSVCPFIDMFNHDSRAQSECVYAPWRSEFRVAAGEPYRVGQQVVINYGSQSNDALLQRYGFVQLDGNPHDRYVLQDLRSLLERVLAQMSGMTHEEARAAVRSLPATPGSLDQVSITAGGPPKATLVAVDGLLASLGSQRPRGASAGAVLSAACAEELAAAGTTLEEDEAAMAQLVSWEVWGKAEELRQSETTAISGATVDAPAPDSARASTTSDSNGVGGLGLEQDAEASAVCTEATGALEAGVAMREAASCEKRECVGDEQREGSPELLLQPVAVLPPNELALLGGDVERCRTVLMFRVAKKRVLKGLR